MQSITEFLSDDHRRCDELLFLAEAHAVRKEWHKAVPACDEFLRALEAHLSDEEEILFPALDSMMGAFGPTHVMRTEHRQIRLTARAMEEALARQDLAEFLGELETLNMMIQQHNLKEESMLYVMADRMLAEAAADLIGAMGEARIGA